MVFDLPDKRQVLLPTSTPTVITAPPRPSDEIECRSVGAHLNGEPVSIIRRVRLLEGQLHVSGTIGSEQSPERSLPCKPINTGVYCERAFGPVTITVMTKKDSMIESVTDQAGKEQAGAAYACDRPISFAPAAISLSPTTSKQPQAAAMLKPAPVPARQPYQAASPAPAPAPLVLPKAISPKYASEDFGQARMHTCLEQYIANKTTNSNGGMKWIEGGGGYYSACNKNLK